LSEWADAELELASSSSEMILQNDQQLAEQKAQIWNASFSAFTNFTNAMYTLGGKQSKKMFELNKVAGIAEATVTTYQAANKTWAQWGYPWGIPMVAAVVASGLANVSAISSQSFGGGAAAAGSAAGGASVPDDIASIVNQPVVSDTKKATSVTINIHGNVVDHDAFAREVIPSLAKAINDGETLEIS
jgi:hypothetical protein